MRAKFHSWWQKSWLRSWWIKIKSGLQWLGQKIRQHPIATGLVMLLITLAAFAFGVHMSGWDWTGFNGGYSKTTTTSTAHGITTSTEQPVWKTFWDWLQLLIVPLILVIGGFLLNQLQKNRDERVADQRTKAEQQAAEKRAQTERSIAEDNQREAALQIYLDRISELLLKESLRESEPNAEVRNIARVRTLTILPRLNGRRKSGVLRFLCEAHLIDKDSCIIKLEGADLSYAYIGKLSIELDAAYTDAVYDDFGKANKETIDDINIPPSDIDEGDIDLHNADLSGVNLEYAILEGVNLAGTKLIGAKLSHANLANADLTEADLSYAYLSGATLFEAELRKANMSRINLQLAWLGNADLIEANLSQAHMYKVNLREADMSNANLRGATLHDADLNFADLSGANLIGADLRGANLKDADLGGADLSDANLKGVKGITVEQLEKQAKSLKGAIMLNGDVHPETS